MSKESDLFVEGIKASLEYMAPETEKLYKAKLSNFKLSKEQWSRALDAIIRSNTEGKLPQLSKVFAFVYDEQREGAPKTDYGWRSFEWERHRYSVRVYYRDGQWLNAATASQKYPYKVPSLPFGATDIQICPDNAENYIRREDQVSLKEAYDKGMVSSNLFESLT